MKRALFAVLVVGLVVGTDEKQDDNNKDLDHLKGNWTIVSMERDGKTDESAVDGKFSFDGEHVHVQMKDMEHKATFKLHTGKKPKQIDVTPTDGPEKDKVLKGIYELAKDELKICIGNDSGAARPKAFESKEGSYHLLVKLKREK